MQNTIILVTVFSLLSTTAPALAQEAEIPADQTADASVSADVPVQAGAAPDVTIDGALVPPIMAAPAEPAPAVALTPTGALLAETSRAPSRRKPHPSSGRLAGELAVGTATGVGMVVATTYLAYGLTSAGCDGDYCELDSAVGSVLLGSATYPVGVGLGVSLVGHVGDHKGSTMAAIGGAYVGALAGTLVGMIAVRGSDADENLAVLGYLIGAPVGAAIGFNTTLDYDRPTTGLLNVSDNGTRLSIPAVSISQDPVHANRTVTSVRVMDARF